MGQFEFYLNVRFLSLFFFLLFKAKGKEKRENSSVSLQKNNREIKNLSRRD